MGEGIDTRCCFFLLLDDADGMGTLINKFSAPEQRFCNIRDLPTGLEIEIEKMLWNFCAGTSIWFSGAEYSEILPDVLCG